jgi:hypothetical protein
MSAVFPDCVEFARQLRIPNLIRVEIRDAHTDSVFYFTRAKIMEHRPPVVVCFQILSRVFGNKDVSGVTAIHHPLRHVKTGPSEIGVIIHIYHPADWTAVHAHSNLQAWMRFERATDFNRALRRRFLTRVED